MALDEGLQGVDQSEIKRRKKNAAWQHEWRKNNPNHHWDDENMRKGIWVCFQCHRFVETIDRGWHLTLLGKYLRLKEEINNG